MASMQRCGLETSAIEEDHGSLAGWRAYLCGSPPMVEAATLLARRKGIDPAWIVRSATDAHFKCEANYAVFRTKLSDATTVFNVGRYLDTVVRTPDGFKFASRECIHDSEMIPNSIIYPI
jgi:NAD(P)H-flavin reductase